MIIDKSLLDQVSVQAKTSLRLRKNYNFCQSLEDKCHRMLNAVEPGTVVPDGSIIEDVVLSQESGNYGVDIPKNVWHKLESLESGSVIFECKEGPFVEHEVEGVLDLTKG